MKKIAFICVNYFNSQVTFNFCKSIEKQLRIKEFSIVCIVVDNSCDENESNQLREKLKQYAWVRIVNAERNLGYFNGLNLGIDSLSESEFDFMVVCNNDIEFAHDFCSTLAQSNYRSSIYAVCPNVITLDGINQNPHHRNRIALSKKLQFDLYFSHYSAACMLSWIKRLFFKTYNNRSMKLDACEIYQGVGAIYILTKSFFSRNKKLFFPHFLYGEEAYFSHQISSTDGTIWFDPSLTVIHAESATLARVPKRTAYNYAKESYWLHRKLL